ncbi:Stb6p [Sugiyamaella lignohabitans]|uniref:Stb6p n=1 Tax=Sugiyamaella lignohabitans TaxID=796027 RepID=A0A167FTH6_9ASCO|nr:Stb6p [Sugiyamaella lignohabitans]ANB15683.1 Stb6p [Sugiyamaella lignohabitans]
MEPGYAYIKERISPIYHASPSKTTVSLPLLAKKLPATVLSGLRKDGEVKGKEKSLSEKHYGDTRSTSSPNDPTSLTNYGAVNGFTGSEILSRSVSATHIKDFDVDTSAPNQDADSGPEIGSNANDLVMSKNSLSQDGTSLSTSANSPNSTYLTTPVSTSLNTSSNASSGKGNLSKSRTRNSRSLSPTLVVSSNGQLLTNLSTNYNSKASTKNSNADKVRYIMVDTTTVSRLVNEPGCKLVESSIELEGYEVYIVEQWACERKLNASITSYTGNTAHKIRASVLSLPKDTNMWSDVIRAHFDELFKLHLRPKETGHGLLFVSNLSSFPSNLNIVPVPDGDISKATDYFDVNEDLRRTGCGGRLVLTIGAPPDSCSDKFKQLFKTHDKVPIMFAVRELVTLVQIGLYYCNLLEPQLVDGLLCNASVRAISNWWDEMGKMRYRAYPKDGMLGPTTVSAIIGFITGIRSRLASLNYKPPKDPFDAEEFITCIKQFQKHERLPRTSRLDIETIRRLYSLTSSKGTNSDLFGIVKSTMKEVSGKQVQNVADAEVLDIERLLNHLQGRRARYLWLGKGHMRTIMSGGTSTTGIPLEALTVSEISSSNLDIKKAMRSVRKPTQVRYRVNGTRSNVSLDNENYEDEQHNFKPPATLTEEQQPWLYENTGKQRSAASSKRSHRFRKYLSVSGNSTTSSAITPVDSSFRSPYSTSDEDLATGNYESSEDEGDVAPTESDHLDKSQEVKDDSRICQFDTDGLICCQQAHDDCSLGKFVDNDEKKMDRYNLRRTQSFSIVEEVVLKWKFDRPAPKLAKTYLSAMRTRQKLVGEVSLLGDISHMYDQKIKSMSLFLNKDKILVNGLNSRVQGVMEKEINVKNLINDVDALVARLHYESRMLTSKLRDVEESVDAFALRVLELESRIDRMDKTKKEYLGDIPQEYGYTESLLKRYLGWLPPLQKYLTP